jgi:WD40 repeat protein
LPWTWSKPSCIACISGTEQIAVGGWDGAIHVAETTDLDRPPYFLGQHADGGAISIDCSADGKYVASRSAGSLRVWDLASKELLWDHVATDMTCHAIDSASESVISGHYDRRIEAWNLKSGESLWTKPIRFNRGTVRHVRIPVDGSLLVTLGSTHGENSESLLLRRQPDKNNWKDEFTLPCGLPRVCVISPDCGCVVTTSEADGSLLDVWEVRSGKRLGTLLGHRQMVLGAVFSSNRLLVTWSSDGTVRVWDVANQSVLNVVVLPLA